MLRFPESSEDASVRYFDEQPLLPHPINYVDVKVTSNSSSSSNGKVTSAVYGFSPRNNNDSVQKTLDDYLAALQGAGLQVLSGDDTYIIMSGTTILAQITTDEKAFRVSLIF